MVQLQDQHEESTAFILDLPPELVVDILALLNKSDQKRFRLVSKACANLVAPLLFAHIYFDFDAGGTDGLVALSRQPELRQYVHTIELRRRAGIRAFDDIDAWKAATIYEYAFDTSEDSDVGSSTDAMTQHEWNMLPSDAIEELYNTYCSDQQAIEEHASQLSSALSAIIYKKHDQSQTNVAVSGIHQILADFDSAIARLSSASHFIQSSRYMDDDWGIYWRRIQFHHDGIADGSTEADESIDNVQLFAALCAMMLSTNTVTSIELCTRGYAFWSAAYLRRLLDWSESPRLHWDPLNAGSDQWIDAIGGPLKAFEHIEAATRHLVRIEGAFSRLASLECLVDTVGVDERDELVTIATALSNTLKQATNLQSLQLSFCELAWCPSLQTPSYSDKVLSGSHLTRAWLTPLVSASARLFAGIIRSQTIGRLRKLELSLTTVENHLSSLLLRLPLLRHLALRRIAIVPGGGHWEGVFQKVSQHLQLQSIELLSLEDVPDGHPRILLEPTASMWTSPSPEGRCYSCYHGAIVRFLLRQSTLLPPLDPEDFVRQYSQEHCSGHKVEARAERNRTA
ncbi:hypothetical protein LTR56_026679 [Elasticomyces elasticus]|nr:hypothetical protein LTR56_026679 [Elasticomyces elasticus]